MLSFRSPGLYAPLVELLKCVLQCKLNEARIHRRSRNLPEAAQGKVYRRVVELRVDECSNALSWYSHQLDRLRRSIYPVPKFVKDSCSKNNLWPRTRKLSDSALSDPLVLLLSPRRNRPGIPRGNDWRTKGQDCIPGHSVVCWRQDRNNKENLNLRRPIADVGVAKWQTLLATRLTSQPFGPMEFSLDPHSTLSLPKTSKRTLRRSTSNRNREDTL
jgi:hypothetical protein